jgi:glutathione S-transferase
MELFLHHKASPFVRKPLLAIAELAIPVDERVVDFTSTAAMDEYATINPNRRFPALRDGALVLWESNAILRHLAARHDPTWLGRTHDDVARADQWLFWELAHLGPSMLPLQNLRLGFLPEPERSEAALLADVQRNLLVLDRRSRHRRVVHLRRRSGSASPRSPARASLARGPALATLMAIHRAHEA